MSINNESAAAWDAARAANITGVPNRKYLTEQEIDEFVVGNTCNGADGTGNPKARVGSLKAPLHLVPPALSIGVAYALKDGAAKYGAYNWREEPINVSTYIGAILRHLYAYQDGEDYAEDSGVSHLAHVAACCALLMDSEAYGTLVDDRNYGPAAEILEGYLNEAS